ncbi:MAG TPA: TIR domain-containing protein [Candidatus Atribacteria bacterium]|nr:TIR domain-containing protein [Candidatus Atribacteria bacterium]
MKDTKNLDDHIKYVKELENIMEELSKVDYHDYVKLKEITLQIRKIIRKKFGDRDSYLEDLWDISHKLKPSGVIEKIGYREEQLATIDEISFIIGEMIKDLKNLSKRKNKEIEEISKSAKKLEEYEYDIAITFAGEDREIAKNLAETLRANDVKVFYDEFYKSDLWGKKLTKYFQDVYGPKTKFVVLLISKDYPVKDWTDFEFSIIRTEAKQRKTEFILPIKLDDTKMLGVHEDTGYLDYRKEEIKGIVNAILDKLSKYKRIERNFFREFFINSETGEPNFAVVVGNKSDEYIQYVRTFVELVCFKYVGYEEVTTSHYRTEIFGEHFRVNTSRHDVEIDPYSLIIKEDEITNNIKIAFNLLLVGFIEDNKLIKSLIDQGLSKIDWKIFLGGFELIPDAFTKGKDVIICSGKNTQAVLEGLKKLANKL